jgi:hypothetical protein
MKGVWLLALGLGCKSDPLPPPPVPSATPVESTTIVYGSMDDAGPTPDCTVHGVGDSFNPARAKQVGTVRVEGDYTRTLAKVSVERTTGAPWSGTFSGPREMLFDMLRRHLCTTANAYALKPGDNKDPTKGAVVLTAYELVPDEKADVDALCNAVKHAGDAGAADERDRAAMAWATDMLTTPSWDAWRRAFARTRNELFNRKADAMWLFHARAADLETAAAGLGITACPTAAEWKKR